MGGKSKKDAAVFNGAGRALPLLFAALLTLAVTGCATSGSASSAELAEAYFELGNAYMDLEQWQKARQAYEKALQAQPGMRRGSYNLSRALVRSGDLEAAKLRLNKLLQEDPHNSILLETLAWVYTLDGKLQQASETYRTVLTYSPHDTSTLYNLALLEAQRERWQAAQDYLLQIVELGEADAEVYYQLGQAASMVNREKAAAWFARAVEQNPDSVEYSISLAEAYAANNDYHGAAEVYQKLAGSVSPDRGEYLFRQAYVLLTGAEDYQAGLKTLEAAINAGYSDPSELAGLLYYPQLLDPQPIEELLSTHGLLEKVQDAKAAEDIQKAQESQEPRGEPELRGEPEPRGEPDNEKAEGLSE